MMRKLQEVSIQRMRPEAQTFELVEHSIAVAVPDTQETTVDTSDFLSYEMSTELGSVVEEVATEPSSTVDTIDPNPSEMTTVLPSVLGEIAAESPIAVVELEDEDIDELEGDLSYPDESPAPTTIDPGALEGSQVQSFDLISPTVSQEPILSPTEDTESSEQAQAQRDDTPALTPTTAENDNMVATSITGHNPISSPTSVSRPPPVLSADPYPASLSTPLYWTNEIPSSSLPTLPFVSAENSVGPVNPIATHPKSPSKEKKGENGDEDSDAEGDIDPDYVEISGSATSTRSPSPPSAGNTSREPSSLPQPSQDFPAKNTLEFSQENEDAVKALPGPSGSLEASPSPESTERPEADNFDLIQTAEDEGHDKDLVHETPVLTVDPITETDPFKLMGNNSTVAPGAVEVDKQDLDGPQPAEESKDTPTPDSVEQGEKGDDIKGEQPEVSSNITSIPVEKNGTVDGPSKDDGNSTPGVSGSSARSGSNTSTRGSKRKRKSPNLTSVRQNRNLVPQKDSSIRIKSPGKGKGKRKQRQESETPSMSSSGASTAAKMLQPSSRASSVGSSATGGGSTIAHPSPSFAHSKEISFPTPAIPQLMLHSHSRLPRGPYQPIRPSLSLQTQIQTKAPSTTKSSISPNSPDPASSPSRPTPQVSRSASMSSPVSTTRSTRSTRSNCRYHKISLPEEEDDGPHIFFLVPGCSLVDSELIKEEDIQDHGDATYEDSLRKVGDIETLDIHPYVLGVIRQLVGPDKEQDVYFLPKLQEERARKVRHKKRLSKLSLRDYGAYGETHDSNGVLLSPASSRPPVSAAGSTSTSASRRKKGYDADSYSSGEEDDSDPEGEEHAEPPNKKSKTSREENGDSQSNLQTAAAKSSKRVLKRRLGSDAAEYQPGNTDEETEEGSDAEPSRRRKHGKKALNLKRSRTDTQDGRRTKKPKIRTSVWDTSDPSNQYQAQSSVDPDQHTDLQPESH
ncbi:hypothetical protein K435DRAFT_137743 [Dendrothele bispora CBS 962.96]|uniref:Uncharacterized protein n=1 Tax=Dendrothele bispora (strain CBS 962.96) TaxID=1314807 RepID=A0A4S8MQ14_DENBC|nr:hypothetical protein K435DRAFT_137743 [Dendrothele bispora CBS 962.96]